MRSFHGWSRLRAFIWGSHYLIRKKRMNLFAGCNTGGKTGKVNHTGEVANLQFFFHAFRPSAVQKP